MNPNLTIHNNSSPLSIQSKQSSTVVAQGRIIGAIGSLTKALIELILKIFNAVFYLFGPYRLKLYSIHDEKPALEDQTQIKETKTPGKKFKVKVAQSPITPLSQRTIRSEVEVKVTDDEARAFFEQGKIKTETNSDKLDQVASWVVRQTSLDRTQAQSFLTDFVRKKRNDLTYKEAYTDWLETLNQSELARFLELLKFEIPEGSNFEKADPPLFIHIKKEQQLAGLTGESKNALVRNRSKILFALLTKQHAEVLVNNEDFWNLVSQFPKEAAKNLKVEAIAILIQNKSKHNDPFKKLISYLPDDDLLHEKLAIMTKHATLEIEKALIAKTERLTNFEYNDKENTPVTKEQRQKLKKTLNREIKTRVTPLKAQNVSKAQNI